MCLCMYMDFLLMSNVPDVYLSTTVYRKINSLAAGLTSLLHLTVHARYTGSLVPRPKLIT